MMVSEIRGGYFCAQEPSRTVRSVTFTVIWLALAFFSAILATFKGSDKPLSTFLWVVCGGSAIFALTTIIGLCKFKYCQLMEGFNRYGRLINIQQPQSNV